MFMDAAPYHPTFFFADFIMVDPWEVEQKDYTRTLYALQSIRQRLERMYKESEMVESSRGASTTSPPIVSKKGSIPATATPRVVLVCGADVVESMADPAIWRQDLLEKLLSDHGVVCISRDGAGIEAGALLEASKITNPDSLLNRYKDNIVLIQDPVPNEVSSSAVRHELEQGRSVRYLVPDSVIDYIHQHGLYGGKREGTKP